MSDAVLDAGATPARPRKTIIRRHRLLVRINHWINVVALLLMLFSGLQIFNAHPHLYWGQKSTFADPWVSMDAQGDRGRTKVGGLVFDTTGVLGRSKVDGVWQTRGFPAWLTLPAQRNLAVGRNWHLFFAWVFALNGLVYLVTGLAGRRLLRDVVPTKDDLKHIGKDIVDHARLKFPKGREAARYQVLQRLAYSAMVFIVLPLIVLTGLTMSPGLNAAFPFMLDIFGGRQSARTIHFICMVLIVGFILIHVAMVILAGPINQLRGMITGKFAIEEEAP